MSTSLISPSIVPGNYFDHKTINFGFTPEVSGVVMTTGPFAPSLSKYIAYDTLTPPGPFIAVTEDGRGRVIYDGGFPKFYNSTLQNYNNAALRPKSFSELRTGHKYLYNCMNWIANPAKPKKLLVIGDAPINGSYAIKNPGAGGFFVTMTHVAMLAGFTCDVKDVSDYSGSLDMTAAELDQYAAVILVSSVMGPAPLITPRAVDNLVAYREAGNGIAMISDHGYNLTSVNDVNQPGSGFFRTANAIAARFGAYFTGTYDRTAVNVGFLRSTYGDHPVYNGLLDTENFPASASESMIVVQQNTIFNPSEFPLITTSLAGINQYNFLLRLENGDVYSEKFQYNVQANSEAPYKLTVTNAGRALINTAIANGTSLQGVTYWQGPGVIPITPTTVNLPGVGLIGGPSVGGSVDKKSTLFVVHHSHEVTYPITGAIKYGDTLIGGFTLSMANGATDNPQIFLLLLENAPPTLFDPSADGVTDILTSGSFDEAYAQAQQIQTTRFPVHYEGQTLYGQGLDQPAKPESILREVEVVRGPLEFAAAKENNVSMADIFNTWTRFSHRAAQFPSSEAIPSELLAWRYDAAQDLILCTLNSVSFIGFISPQNYLNYDLDLTVASTNSDDDLIGVVVAANYEDGKLWTLSVCRSTGGNARFAMYYGYGYSDQVTVAERSSFFKWGNGQMGATAAAAGYVSNDPNMGWRANAGGARLRVERRGDVIKVWTSQLNETTLVEEAIIVLDLASAPRYEKFRGGSRYGYSAASQSDSYYKVASFIDYDRVIVHAVTNLVYIFNGTDWVIDPSRLGKDIIKNGHFAFSSKNKKLFYRDEIGELLLLN